MAHRLPAESVFRSVYDQHLFCADRAARNIKASSKDSLDYVQRLGLLSRLRVHSGCVNSVHWNRTGEYLLSGSDDQCLAVTNPHNNKMLLKYKTAHRANIFSARFLPESNDKSVVSCSGDGIVLYTELMAPDIYRMPVGPANDGTFPPTYHRDEGNHGLFNCHKSGTTYEVLTMPTEPRSFLSCGEDGTVRLFDLRQISSCHKTCCKDNILIFSPTAVNAMDLAPINQNYLAVGSSDSIVRIYDRRYLSIIDFSDSSVPTKDRHTRPVKAYAIPLPTKRRYRITCVKYSPEESELLVSYSCEFLYLFNLQHDGIDVDELHASGTQSESSSPSPPLTTEQVTRRLRLRGDWSDTGPEARPDRDSAERVEPGQVRPQLQANLMSRMTEVIARMLNDPRTRLGLLAQSAQDMERNTPQTERQQNTEAPSTSRAWRNAASRSLAQMRLHSSGNEAENSATNDRTASEDSDDDNDNDEDERVTEINESSALNADEDEEEETAALNDELAELDMQAKNADCVNPDDESLYDFIRMKFVGHRNARTMIKEANFWGSNYVMSGSDCGHIFIWNRHTGKLAMTMQADQHVVNCLQPHPELPYLASSGIDYDVKIWAPILKENSFNEVEAEDLQKRNAVMLEQTKDTVTVPAAFMIRMLACIRSLRNRERANSDTNQANTANHENNSSNNNNDNNGSAESSANANRPEEDAADSNSNQGG